MHYEALVHIRKLAKQFDTRDTAGIMLGLLAESVYHHGLNNLSSAKQFGVDEREWMERTCKLSADFSFLSAQIAMLAWVDADIWWDEFEKAQDNLLRLTNHDLWKHGES